MYVYYLYIGMVCRYIGMYVGSCLLWLLIIILHYGNYDEALCQPYELLHAV